MKTLKTLIVGMVALFTLQQAAAMTWWVGPTLFGNVCRNGAFFTVYPTTMGQPVGSSCPLRDNFGNVIGMGIVSNE